MAEHIFITGGTGFIGSALCRQLTEEERNVTVLTRDAAAARGHLPQRINLVEDLAELDAAPPVSAVINLAGEPLADRRWTEKRKALFYSSRVGLTENLFAYFSRDDVTSPQVLVSGSAIGYYGPRGEESLDESADSNPCFASDLCRAWESMAVQFENLGTRVCLIRTGIVLGPGGGALKAMLPPFRLGLGGPIGDGQQWMSWIHRNDMVALLCAVLDNPQASGPINATAPEPVRNKEFSRVLGHVLHRPAFLPMPALLVRALFGEMADELLLASQRVLPARAQALGFDYGFPRLEPALQEILHKH